MQKLNIISKSISVLLLVVMLYMHVCSAWCAAGCNSCEAAGDNHCKKACCTNGKNSESKDHDCQSLHFSFFKAAGQFSSEKIAEAQIAFTVFTGSIAPFFLINPIESSRSNFAYNGFHPPPPGSDIRIFIQSFQI
ncbi:MAG: hypothetical protein ABJB16_15405 [Saprospiraceae bacterium]